MNASLMVSACVVVSVLVAQGCSAASQPHAAERAQAPSIEQPEPAERPEQPPAASYELGALPEPFREVRWPAPPRIERELKLGRSQRVVDRSGTRVRVRGRVERLDVRADDIDLVLEPEARVGQLVIERGRRRIRIAGGRFGSIELVIPAQHHPPPAVWRREWMIEDVTIDGVEVEAADSGFFVRGRRVAILRSRVRAERYAVWCGDTDDFQSEDLVLAGNRFESAGPEATVRLVSVRRAIVVDNVMVNTIKHDFRVHGDSDEVVLARNRLVNTGIMVGSMEGDRIGSVWILENALHHRVPSLFEVEPRRVRRLVVRGNRVFSDVWRCFVCNRAASEWEIGDDAVAPYEPPTEP